MKYQDKIITAFATDACEKVSNRVIKDLRQMTQGMQSGDDSGLKNIWDEICVQVQGQQSVMWEIYLDIVRDMIEREVKNLSHETIESIWLQTEEGSNWDIDNQVNDEENIIGKSIDKEFYFIQIEPKSEYVENEIPGDVDYNLDDITDYVLQEYVLKKASDWTNKRIEKNIEQGLDLI